jgi:hypothetical protein
VPAQRHALLTDPCVPAPGEPRVVGVDSREPPAARVQSSRLGRSLPAPAQRDMPIGADLRMGVAVNCSNSATALDGDELLSRANERQGVQFDQPFFPSHIGSLGAERQVPHLEGAVGANRRQLQPIGAEGYSECPVQVAPVQPGLLTLWHGPDPHRSIRAGGGQALAGGVEGNAINAAAVSDERLDQAARGRVPEANEARTTDSQ